MVHLDWGAEYAIGWNRGDPQRVPISRPLGSWERVYKLPRRSPEQIPGTKRIWWTLELSLISHCFNYRHNLQSGSFMYKSMRNYYVPQIRRGGAYVPHALCICLRHWLHLTCCARDIAQQDDDHALVSTTSLNGWQQIRSCLSQEKPICSGVGGCADPGTIGGGVRRQLHHYDEKCATGMWSPVFFRRFRRMVEAGVSGMHPVDSTHANVGFVKNLKPRKNPPSRYKIMTVWRIPILLWELDITIPL